MPANARFDWVEFGTDVLTSVEALGLERPVGVGHSAGAAALLLAEEARPGTFSALYCFEPAMFDPDGPHKQDLSRPLARGARQRREIFASREEAYDNYASKPPLDVLDPEALAAYVEFGFVDLSDGTVLLRCRGETEARIYESGIRNPAFPGLAKIECPVVLACGSESEDFNQVTLGRLAARLAKSRLEVLPSMGHFGPLQDPKAVAESVIRALDTAPA
jgi:pimeloyl-ACP methyl ester carboxylesterase